MNEVYFGIGTIDKELIKPRDLIPTLIKYKQPLRLLYTGKEYIAGDAALHTHEILTHWIARLDGLNQYEWIKKFNPQSILYHPRTEIDSVRIGFDNYCSAYTIEGVGTFYIKGNETLPDHILKYCICKQIWIKTKEGTKMGKIDDNGSIKDININEINEAFEKFLEDESDVCLGYRPFYGDVVAKVKIQDNTGAIYVETCECFISGKKEWTAKWNPNAYPENNLVPNCDDTVDVKDIDKIELHGEGAELCTPIKVIEILDYGNLEFGKGVHKFNYWLYN